MSSLKVLSAQAILFGSSLPTSHVGMPGGPSATSSASTASVEYEGKRLVDPSFGAGPGGAQAVNAHPATNENEGSRTPSNSRVTDAKCTDTEPGVQRRGRDVHRSSELRSRLHHALGSVSKKRAHVPRRRVGAGIGAGASGWSSVLERLVRRQRPQCRWSPSAISHFEHEPRRRAETLASLAAAGSSHNVLAQFPRIELSSCSLAASR